MTVLPLTLTIPNSGLEAGDHPEAGGLAAARGTDDRHELPLCDVEIDVVEDLHAGLGRAEDLVDTLEADRTHLAHPQLSSPRRRRSQPSPCRRATSMAMPTTPMAIIPLMTVAVCTLPWA